MQRATQPASRLVACQINYDESRTAGANTITLFIGYSTGSPPGALYCGLNLESLRKEQRAERGQERDQQTGSAMVEVGSADCRSFGVGRDDDHSQLCGQ
jgi:hypothetical protein